MINRNKGWKAKDGAGICIKDRIDRFGGEDTFYPNLDFA